MGNDIESHKQTKERGASVIEVYDSLEDELYKENVDEMLVILICKDGKIKHAYSTDSVLYLLGAIESTKQILLEVLDEQQERIE